MNKLLATCLSLMLMAGCSGPPSEPRAVNVDAQLCQSTKPYTTFIVGSYTVKIFEPNDSSNPDVWQGPLCISSESNKVNCGFDLSLIKSVKPTADTKALEVVVFSGSNSRTATISLANCQVR